VPSSRFAVSVADLENGPKEVSFTLTEAWLRDVLEPAGASPRGAGSVTLELTQQGHEVMVRGHARFGATLPCVVTLDPVDFDLRPEIFLMLRPGPAERRGAAPTGSKKRPGSPAGRVLPDPKPGKRKRRSNDQDSDPEPPADEATVDTYQGDEIVLDDYVREFLLLELPLYPRRPDLPSSEESLVSRPLAGPTGEQSIDPRLAPLAKIAERLRGAADKE
jgi:uncharacterized metal-binding protein YceD (DUF177 family)